MPTLLICGPAFAQQVPHEIAPDRENPTENAPNWPPGLESWESGEWEPPNVDPEEAERRGLTSPEVRESLMPDPTPQGTRPPSGFTPDAGSELYNALSAVRVAPPGLDGMTVPRPNPLASEPAKEMEPVGGPDDLFPEDYTE